MSYCVHCGVKLTDGAASCPLCGTPVIDPNRTAAKAGGTAVPMFSERDEDRTAKRINPRFVASMIFAVLAVPFAVTAIVDLCVPANLTWALYVIGGLALAWVLVMLPLHLPKRQPYMFLLVDGADAVAMLALVAAFNHGWRWFLILGLPCTALAMGAALMVSFVLRRRTVPSGAKAGWLLVIAAVTVMCVGVVVGLYRGTGVLPVWGWASAIPCVVLGVLLIILSYNDRFAAWAERRLFL